MTISADLPVAGGLAGVSGGRIAGIAGTGTLVVFRNDDLSAASEAGHESRVAAVFERYDVPQTLGVVPRTCPPSEYHCPRGTRHCEWSDNPAMKRWLLEHAGRSGSEIAMHGYAHRPNRLSMPSRRECMEFQGLPFDEQREMIAAGLEEIEEALGVRPATFIPPWNRLDEATVAACRANGLRIISSGPYVPVLDGVTAVGANCDLHSFPTLIERDRPSETPRLLVICYHSRMIQTSEDFAALERAVRLTAETPNCRVLTIAGVAGAYDDLTWLANAAAINVVQQSEVLGTHRARTVCYRRCLEAAGCPARVEGLLAQAQTAYQAGDYAAAAARTAAIDRSVERLLRHARLGLGILAGFSGVVAALASTSLPAASRFWIMTMPAMIAGILGGLARWFSTSRDTRREMTHVTVIALACTGLGAVAVEIVRIVFS